MNDFLTEMIKLGELSLKLLPSGSSKFIKMEEIIRTLKTLY